MGPNSSSKITYVTFWSEGKYEEQGKGLLASLPEGCNLVIGHLKFGSETPIAEYDRTEGTIKHVNITMPSEDMDGSALRNLFNQFVDTEWIFMLDADHRLCPHEHGYIEKIVNGTPETVGGILVKEINYITIKAYVKEGDFLFERVLLYRNNPGIYWEEPMHEATDGSIINGMKMQVGRSGIHVHHVGYDTTAEEYLQRLKRNASRMVRKWSDFKNKERICKYIKETMIEISEIERNYNIKEDFSWI